MDPVSAKRSYDPGLLQPNAGSRAAVNPILDEGLAILISKLKVKEIMDLAETRQQEFQQIHENIRDFYVLNNGRITSMQKATMAAFLLKYPELFEEQVKAAPAKEPIHQQEAEQQPVVHDQAA